MNRIPPEVVKTDEHAGNMLAGRFDISRNEAVASSNMAIVLLYGHKSDTHSIAIRIRAAGSIGFLKTAKVLGDSGWSPGYIAAEIARWCRGAEIIPSPEPDEFFGRDHSYLERWGAEYGGFCWNLSSGTCEGWGDGFADTHGDCNIDIFEAARPVEGYKHGES